MNVQRQCVHCKCIESQVVAAAFDRGLMALRVPHPVGQLALRPPAPTPQFGYTPPHVVADALRTRPQRHPL